MSYETEHHVDWKEDTERSVTLLQEFGDELHGMEFIIRLDLSAEPDERFLAMIFHKGAVAGQQPQIFVKAPDLDILLEKAKEGFEKWRALVQEVRTTTMAVFIMKQISEQGYVTRDDLIRGHFGEAEIDALSKKALDKAAELAKPDRFKIS